MPEVVRHLRRARPLRRGLGAFLVVFAMAPVVACGGGGGDDLVAPTTDGTETDAGGDGGAFEEQAFSVAREFWHAGFFIELGDGRHFAIEDDDAFAEDVRYFVSIEAFFENQGDDAARFDTETVLSEGGSFYEPTSESDLPTIPGGLSGNGTFMFEVEEGFDLADATLIVGSGGEHRSEVPLGREAGEPITFEPRELTMAGQLSLELLDLTLSSGELRADRPVDHTQVDGGQLALTINLDALSRRAGNWTIRASDFALTLPGGSSVVPEGSGLESLPGSADGIPTAGLYVRFPVDEPAEGDYTLRVTAPSWFVGEDGVTQATVDFTLE